MDGEPRLTMSIAEAAARLGVGEAWLRRQALAGLVPHVKFGRSRRFTEEHLQQIIAAREQIASDPWIRSARSQAWQRRRAKQF